MARRPTPLILLGLVALVASTSWLSTSDTDGSGGGPPSLDGASIMARSGFEPAILAARTVGGGIERLAPASPRSARTAGLVLAVALALVAVASRGWRRTAFDAVAPAPEVALLRVTPPRGPPHLHRTAL